MRTDNEHAYDQIIYDLSTIEQHALPEFRFRKLVNALAKKHKSITGMYWLIDVVCSLNPEELPEQRKIALKRLTLKMFTAYDTGPTNQQLANIMRKLDYPMVDIAKILSVSRNTVYYYIKHHEDVPTCCVLTYGEYNLMMDFMDCWHELCNMDILTTKEITDETTNCNKDIPVRVHSIN